MEWSSSAQKKKEWSLKLHPLDSTYCLANLHTCYCLGHWHSMGVLIWSFQQLSKIPVLWSQRDTLIDRFTITLVILCTVHTHTQTDLFCCHMHYSPPSVIPITGGLGWKQDLWVNNRVYGYVYWALVSPVTTCRALVLPDLMLQWIAFIPSTSDTVESTNEKD